MFIYVRTYATNFTKHEITRFKCNALAIFYKSTFCCGYGSVSSRIQTNFALRKIILAVLNPDY